MSKRKIKFSVIICLTRIGPQFFNYLAKFALMELKDFEIILVTEKDAKLPKFSLEVRVVRPKQKPISLGEKRDLGLKAAKGERCAFIDDDAYPNSKWLTNALEVFNSSPKIAVVGGPNVTPPDDTFWEKVGGHIYESYLTSGELQYRFIPKKRRFVGELPGVNLIIRKDVLKKIGGFDSRLYSGDDSKVCSAITSLGYKVCYDPKVIVYHHRRAFPLGHLKQIRSMGKHRGFFVKAYPQTLAPLYFLPTILTLGLLGGLVASIFSFQIRVIYIFSFIVFFLLGYFSSVKYAGYFKSIFVSIGIMLTHIIYGISFIRGMTLKHIERQDEAKK